MIHKTEILLITLLVFLLISASTIKAVPNPEPSETPQISFEDFMQATEVRIKVEDQSSNVISNDAGDTLYFFCPTGTVSMGTFGGTDVWGWVDPDGKEYGIMGVSGGIAFIDIDASSHIQTIPFTPGCGWRDIKTYQHYAYAVSECGGLNDGIIVMDMQYLPDSVKLINTFPIDGGSYPASHNLSIDTIKGYLYAEGFGTGASIFVHSLANPEAPSIVSAFGPEQVHDMYAMNDTVYVAQGGMGKFSIWDLSNKFSAQLLTTFPGAPSGYAHNIWPTADGQYVGTTEETGGKTVKFWDRSDLSNMQLVGEYIGPNYLAHNVQIFDRKAYISHYESGIAVVDLKDPANPVELAIYDNYPNDDGQNYNGCWGVFEALPSRRILASNRNGTLWIFKEKTGVINDTITFADAFGEAGTKIRVQVNVTNGIDLKILVIPFSWAGPLNLIFDSATTTGTRAEFLKN